MAYLVVMDPCLDQNHDACSGHENTPTDRGTIGGGICVCPCHTPNVVAPHVPLVAEVTAYSLARRRRDGGRVICDTKIGDASRHAMVYDGDDLDERIWAIWNAMAGTAMPRDTQHGFCSCCGGPLTWSSEAHHWQDGGISAPPARATDNT